MSDREPKSPADSGEGIDIALTPVEDEFQAPRRDAARAPVPAPPVRPQIRPGTSPRTLPRRLHRRTDGSKRDARKRGTAPAAPSAVREYFEALVVTLVFWLSAMTFIAQPVSVPSGSMRNTIQVGDHIVVNRFLFGNSSWMPPILPSREIRRGDIVVFKHPTDPQNLYIKRVVGLPGETVEIYGTRVYINSQEIAENKELVREASAERSLETVGEARRTDGADYTVYYSQLRDTGSPDESDFSSMVSVDRGTVAVDKPFKIPSGHYFVLGDNRDNSEDSRFWGAVARENIIGRAMFVYWSVEHPDPSESGWSVLDSLTKIRWQRIGSLVE